MKNSIKQELLDYAVEQIAELDLDLNDDELHYKLFNEDYYLIGYYQCSEWLKKHKIGEFESVELLNDLMVEHFGEIHKVDMNSEVVVNQLIFFWGYEIVDELQDIN